MATTHFDTHSEKLLTDKEVAERIGASPATVRRLVLSGSMPKPVKLGRLTRFRLSEILKFIEQAGHAA